MPATVTKPSLEVQPGEVCNKSDCPAYAAVAVEVGSHGRFVFCGHHFDTSPRLHAIDVLVFDERWSWSR